ncbi:MAG: anthranilate phosphoribosyltransferase [Nitrospirae bacterium]|nr:anthranilate phosphoribosyltransferase [Nitrospirota bacterium]
MTFQELIAKIGKGQKGAKDLTAEEAEFAITGLLEEKASPYQVGAFLISLRIKEETPEELAVFTRACKRSLHPLIQSFQVRAGETLDLPFYAGKRTSFHVGLPASLVMAGAGLNVVLHGDPNPPLRISKSMVLAYLGWRQALSLKERLEFFTETGWTYLDIAQIHPGIKRFLDLRNEIGLRSIFHTIARLLNPLEASSQIIGISHPKSYEKIAEAVRALGVSNALVVRGLEGESEENLSGPVEGIIVNPGSHSKTHLEPSPLGLTPIRRSEIEMKDPEAEARITEEILEGKGGKDRTALTLWNASIGLFISGKAKTLQEAYVRSKKSLESGEALQILKAIKKTFY